MKAASRKTPGDPLCLAIKMRIGRAVLGWSQADLAGEIGITQRAIHKLEIGETEPRDAAGGMSAQSRLIHSALDFLCHKRQSVCAANYIVLLRTFNIACNR